MNRSELVQGIVWAETLAAKAKAAAGRLREQLAADARAELVEQGTAPTWRLPDLATVSGSVTHEAVSVVDDKSWIAWVASRYPTEVETVRVVRGAWARAFLESARVVDLVAVDPATGEVIPGVQVRPGGELGGITIRVASAAKEAYGAVAEGSLARLALDAGHGGRAVLEVADVPA